MKEYILWATSPTTGEERVISEKVYDLKEHERRERLAKDNGWLKVRTQIIGPDNDNFGVQDFIKAINK